MAKSTVKPETHLIQVKIDAEAYEAYKLLKVKPLGVEIGLKLLAKNKKYEHLFVGKPEITADKKPNKIPSLELEPIAKKNKGKNDAKDIDDEINTVIKTAKSW